MALLPSYFTTTRSSKRKPKSKTKAVLAAEAETKKLLAKVGFRGVAKPGKAPALGAGDRRFESSHPDKRVLVEADSTNLDVTFMPS